MRSRRLTYRPVEPSDLDAYTGLVQDQHVRRYLMDDQILPWETCAGQIRDSQALFERAGVGLWLAHDIESGDLVGFCGFLMGEAAGALDLVYALREPFTGRGLATEMASACISRRSAAEGIVASVDAVNAPSVRVLEKLGFERTGTRPGAFGDVLLYRLDVGQPSARTNQ